MPLVIPLRNDLPNFTIDVVLDAVSYNLEFRFNTRDKFWYLTVRDETDDVIAASLKLVIDHPLGARITDPRWPPGALLAQDTSGQRRDPTYDAATKRGDLGDRVILLYFEAAELPV